MKEEGIFENIFILTILLIVLLLLSFGVLIFLRVNYVLAQFLALFIASLIINKLYSVINKKTMDDGKRKGISFFYAFASLLVSVVYLTERIGMEKVDYAVYWSIFLAVLNFIVVYIFLYIGAAFFAKPTKKEIKEYKEEKVKIQKQIKEIKKEKKIKLEKKAEKKVKEKKFFEKTSVLVFLLLVISTLFFLLVVDFNNYLQEKHYRYSSVPPVIPLSLTVLALILSSFIVGKIYSFAIKKKLHKKSKKKIALSYAIIIMIIFIISIFTQSTKPPISLAVFFTFILFLVCYFLISFFLGIAVNLFNKMSKKK